MHRPHAFGLRRLGMPACALLLAMVVTGCDGEAAGVTPSASTTGSAVPNSPTSVVSAQPSAAASVAPSGSADAPATELEWEMVEYSVTRGSHPHDVAPATDGGVWYTGQRNGTLGYLDPATGDVREVRLGAGSAPHGVIVGPDGAPWITDGGLNAIVRVDPDTEHVDVHPLPDTHPDANLNTAAFDTAGVLWFTGQNGVYGRFDPKVGEVEAWDAPRGRGPYGITATPDGGVWYASLAGSHVARIDPATAEATIVEPPTAGQGARRIWSDSTGRLWVSEWEAGQVAMHDPATGTWQEWPLPGDGAQAYAVYVDDTDAVWLTDFTANAIVRFDLLTEEFTSFELPKPGAAVRQLLGRPGELWGAESALDALVVIRAR